MPSLKRQALKEHNEQMRPSKYIAIFMFDLQFILML